jgi:hypothetical protein
MPELLRPGGYNDHNHPDRPRIQSRYERRKKSGAAGARFITECGRPAHVLLTIEDYRRLAGGNMSLVEALAQPDGADFEFKPPRVGGMIKPAKLG